ncbi:hypothetical protein [Aurantiacibacter gilvus]|uniref:Uncharacterized protein n=1 Tax=Aurantiacibacter gilvus TaxID=3139141 RepID=A0ABU9IHI1_9SPHN
MKPQLVVWFDYLFWLGVLAAVCGLYLNFDLITGSVADVPGARAGAVVGGILGFSVTLGLYALGWFFISRKGSKIAHWIFTLITGAVLAFTVFGTLMAGFQFGVFPAVLDFARFGMWFLGAVLLFLPEARPWFDKGTPNVPDTFD